METKYLKSFEVVYETRSINQAAKKLFITPQGLSKSMQQLEQELGVTLFERSPRGMIPTQSADLLYDRVQELLFRFEALERELIQTEHRKTRLRLGGASGVFNVVPFHILLDYMKDHPNIEIEYGEYSNDEVKQMLVDSRLDYGLIVGAWDEPEAVTRMLGGCDIRLLVYEGHPLYSKDRVTIDMLRGEPLVTMTEKFRMFHSFADACRVRGFFPKILAKTADPTLQYNLCRDHLALSIVPSFTSGRFSMEGLRAIPFEEDLRWEVYAASMKGKNTMPAVETFDEYLRSRIR